MSCVWNALCKVQVINIRTSTEKITFSETFVALAETFSLVWLTQTFTQNVTERFINETS